MRVTILIALLGMTGCADSPASLGITGPGSVPLPEPAVDDSTVRPPGIPDSGGSYYGPSVGPAPASGRYFNYN